MVGSADQLPRADPSEPCRGALLHTALPGPQPRPQRRRDPGPRSSPSGLRSIWGLAFVLKRPADMGLRPHQRDLTKRPLERRPLLPVEEPVQLPCRACERVIAFRTGLLLRCCCETRSMMDPICNRGKSAGERWLEMNAIAPIEPAHPRSLICFASGVRATLRSSCSPWRRSRMVGGPSQARAFGQPAAQLPAHSHVDAGGISQVPRRFIPCLCPGPRPRPDRRSLTLAVSSMLPPLNPQRRLQR